MQLTIDTTDVGDKSNSVSLPVGGNNSDQSAGETNSSEGKKTTGCESEILDNEAKKKSTESPKDISGKENIVY